MIGTDKNDESIAEAKK